MHNTPASRLISLSFSQNITVLLQGTSDELVLLPQVGCQEAVCVADSNECGLECVLQGLCATSRCSVGILDTCQLQQSLDSGRRDETSSSRCWDEPDCDGAALAGLFGWERMWLTEVGTPVATTDRKDGELSNDDGGANRSCDFLRCLDAETNVTLTVTNDHNGLESSSLTGTSLLLNWLDLNKL